LKITIVLNDNHSYGCIHNLQRGSGGRSFGNEFRERARGSGRLEGAVVPVDFAKNAESLGAKSYRAESIQSLRTALAAAKKDSGVVFIYVPVRADVGVPGFSWWDVPVSATSQVPGVQKARAAYEKAKKRQRFYY
jgi:3D-(3,5/4)-trihydroxycyclohexane-1,2-dione acylhydrolase (decyclizing)